MSILQVPPPEFLVRGQDGRDYPADLDALRQWVRAGRITSEQQVYSYPSGAWSRARELVGLRELFIAPATEKQGSTGLSAGCAITLGLLVFLAIGSLIFGWRSQSHRSSPLNTSTPSTSAPPGLGSAVKMNAADLFTTRFAGSALSSWGIRGHATGADCGVLLVTFDVNMEDSMINSLHYGNRIYGSILPGGVARFYPERGFRGVVYRDADGHRWTYGAVSSSEASSLSPC